MKRTLKLRETSNNTKHLNKNENYNEILEMPFVFNLQTVLMAGRRRRSTLSQPEVVGCGQEVVERVYLEDHIRPGDEGVITIDEAPWRSGEPHSQKKSSRTTPLPQASQCRCRDGIEAVGTLLNEAPPPPSKRRPNKP